MDRKEDRKMKMVRAYRLKAKGLIAILLIACLPCHAEHLFEVGLHGGVAAWDAQTSYVNAKIGGHYGAQVYYSFLTPYVVGLRTGVSVDCHNMGFQRAEYEDSYTTIDVDNQRMEIDYTIGMLNERYNLWSVGVPLQLSLTRKRFTFLAGAKAVFPLVSNWTQTVEHAALSVYYPDFDNRVYESYPLAASRDFDMKQQGKLKLPTVQWWLSLELNYTLLLDTWATNVRTYMIFGAYFDYCLSKEHPTTADAESLIMLSDTRDGFPLQRILTPVMNAQRKERPLVRECEPFDIGIKVSFALAPYDPHQEARHGCNCLK